MGPTDEDDGVCRRPPDEVNPHLHIWVDLPSTFPTPLVAGIAEIVVIVGSAALCGVHSAALCGVDCAALCGVYSAALCGVDGVALCGADSMVLCGVDSAALCGAQRRAVHPDSPRAGRPRARCLRHAALSWFLLTAWHVAPPVALPLPHDSWSLCAQVHCGLCPFFLSFDAGTQPDRRCRAPSPPSLRCDDRPRREGRVHEGMSHAWVTPPC